MIHTKDILYKEEYVLLKYKNMLKYIVLTRLTLVPEVSGDLITTI